MSGIADVLIVTHIVRCRLAHQCKDIYISRNIDKTHPPHSPARHSAPRPGSSRTGVCSAYGLFILASAPNDLIFHNLFGFSITPSCQCDWRSLALSPSFTPNNQLADNGVPAHHGRLNDGLQRYRRLRPRYSRLVHALPRLPQSQEFLASTGAEGVACYRKLARRAAGRGLLEDV